MWKFNKCSKCGREYSTYICMNCIEEPPTNKADIPEVIKKVKEIKPDIKKKVIKKEVVVNKEVITWDTINWLPLYTSGYLNHVKKLNLNSIKQEKCCIKYWDKYILHSDIIEQFKQWLVNS